MLRTPSKKQQLLDYLFASCRNGNSHISNSEIAKRLKTNPLYISQLLQVLKQNKIIKIKNHTNKREIILNYNKLVQMSYKEAYAISKGVVV